ncbi:hypothetical protein F5Y02DRAFT_403376 [Annulohypoxylon stygium]|nr:hypothetical protein F5Y02DRAFT_403376 [Annulohypoxylon stygium]
MSLPHLYLSVYKCVSTYTRRYLLSPLTYTMSQQRNLRRYVLACTQSMLDLVLYHAGITTEPRTMDVNIEDDDDEKYMSPFHYCSICKDFQNSTDPVIMPCGHAFCSECIQQWLGIVKCQRIPQHCPYCRGEFKHKKCGHILSPKFLEPGVDLRSPCSLWSFCTTCWIQKALTNIIPIVLKIWWDICALFPEEVREEPRIFQWLFTTLLLYEELREDCYILRRWVHKQDWVYLAPPESDSSCTDEPVPKYPEVYVPWEACVPLLQKEMNALFPRIDVPDIPPTVACIEERELIEFWEFKRRIEQLSDFYNISAQVIDFVELKR